MLNLIITLSNWLIPFFLLLVFGHGYYKGVKVFDTFIQGAKEGFNLAIKLIPFIVGIYVSIAIFRASGALDLLIKFLSPIIETLGIPGDVLPILFIRPLSGPAALGLTSDLINRFGPDSFIGRLASTIDGSTDTTLYIITIYFASVGIKKAGYSLPVGLMADLVGFLAAVYICRLVFL